MDIATGSWFEYLRESERLDEGLYDIGLPENVATFIEDSVRDAPEKAKTYVGNQWKKSTVGLLAHGVGPLPPGEYGREAPGATAFAMKVTNFILDHFLPYTDEFSEDPDSDEYKKLVFVIKNINQTVRNQPFGKWRKAFSKAIKNLSALGVDSTAVGELQKFLSKTMEAAWWRFSSTYTEVLAFLQDHPDNYDEIKDMGMDEAAGEADTYFREKENPDQILHTFPDGSYWYDLQTTACDEEAERMGHCGSDNRGNMISLRKPKEKRKTGSSSYITMSWDDHDNILYQIKGRANSAPPEETWEHINWFVQNMGVKKVEESGEHSDDDFSEFLHFLRDENPGISVGVDMDALVEEAREELHRIMEEEAGDDIENVEIWANASDPYDMYGYDEADHPIIDTGARGTLEINLGWPSMTVDRMTGYRPPKDSGLKSIVANSYSNLAHDFTQASGIEDVANDLEGETEYQWDVRMLTPAIAEPFELGDPEPPETAHLIVTFETRNTAASVDDASLPWFIGQMKDFYVNDYREHVENIRANLAKAGYASRNIWDKEQQSLEDMKLENFQAIAPDASEVSYWLRAPDGQLDNENPMRISNDAFIYWTEPTGKAGERNVGTHFAKNALMTGTRGLKFQYSSDKYINPYLNKSLGQELIALNRQAIKAANDPRQTKLMFGDKYKEQPPPPLELANDIQLIIVPEADPGGLAGVFSKGFGLRYRFKVTVSANNSAEEIERVKGFMKFLDDNPKLVRTAAEEVINLHIVEFINEEGEMNRDYVLGGDELRSLGRAIRTQYQEAANSGDRPNAEKVILLLDWVENRWGEMDEIEKYVAIHYFLKPIRRDQMRIAQLEVQTWRDKGIGDVDLGKPLVTRAYSSPGQGWGWDQYVRWEMETRKAHSGAIKGYSGVRQGTPIRGTLGEPVQAESIEDQIGRVENLLQESDPTYDLRIYKVQIMCALDKDRGGEVQETQTEMRGIPSITIVRSLGDTVRETPQQTFMTMEVKFELLGTEGRVRYRDEVLIPGLMKIKGLKILRLSPIHRINVKGTIRTVRESFGGGPEAAAPQRAMRQKMETPRSSLEDALDDWVQGSVMAYDVAVNTRDMRYTLMLPIKELLPYISREFRAPADAFDGMYQHFIANGPQSPVYVALGKNGRIKITGNEDIVWFAKRAGLEEVPVFISYQRQA